MSRAVSIAARIRGVGSLQYATRTSVTVFVTNLKYDFLLAKRELVFSRP